MTIEGYVAGNCRAPLHMDEDDEAGMSQPLGTQVFPCRKLFVGGFSMERGPV